MEREKILLSDLKIVSGTGILESEVGSYVWTFPYFLASAKNVLNRAESREFVNSETHAKSFISVYFISFFLLWETLLAARVRGLSSRTKIRTVVSPGKISSAWADGFSSLIKWCVTMNFSMRLVSRQLATPNCNFLSPNLVFIMAAGSKHCGMTLERRSEQYRFITNLFHMYNPRAHLKILVVLFRFYIPHLNMTISFITSLLLFSTLQLHYICTFRF